MTRAVSAVVLFMLLMLTASCKDKDLLYDMARFDRAYIPALVLTSKKDTTGQSIVAVKRLRQDWELLSAKRAAIFAADARSEKVKGALEKADSFVTVGEFSKAHVELESIMEILRDARRQYKVDYYLDYLTALHSPVQAMSSAVEGKEPDALTDGDIAAIARALPGARSAWSALMEADFSRGVFLFSKEMEEGLMASLKQESRNLSDLEAALKSGSRILIIRHVRLVKSGYSGVLSMFGNFDSVSI